MSLLTELSRICLFSSKIQLQLIFALLLFHEPPPLQSLDLNTINL